MNVGVTGHQNIPLVAQSFIAEGIRKQLTNCKKGSSLVGLSSLAAGADQLFASIVLSLGGDLHVIIPSEAYSHTFASPDDLDLFRELVDQADHVETLDFIKPSEDAYLAAGRRIVDESDLLVAIWDGLPAKGKGGTADIVDYAKKRCVRVAIIWPDGVRR